MSKDKVRINLKAYDHQLLDVAAGKIVETVKRTGGEISGPVPLPTEIEKVTVLRAVHKYKDARERKLIPVTVIETEPNVVMQVKTASKNGYNAIQLGVFEKKEKQATRPEMGNAKKANTTPKRYLKEIRDVESTYNIGDTISASVFSVGEIVDVTGTTKGKGFQGVIKRHNQSRGPMTHGSHYHRRPGSLGTMLPKRVLKGKKLAGHMGVDTVTIQNLEIIEVNDAENYILVSGNVPGAKNSLVLIKTAVKNSRKEDPKEILTYVDETVVDEVVEAPEVTEEVTETVEEVTDTKEEAKEEESK